jgi:thiosulfate/3-mercaptopyruvate sulfurtransferase
MLRPLALLTAILSLTLLTIPQAVAATPLVDAGWVVANLNTPKVKILDVRGAISGNSRSTFEKQHIPGAVWTDYLQDGWRIKDSNGTVGMLPGVKQLEMVIGNLGIENDDHVIIVPAGERAVDVGTATRIYWTFKVLGHDNVSILDGGMAAYTARRDKNGNPVNPVASGPAQIDPAIYEVKGFRKELIATKADVAKALAGGFTLVDNRPSNQYLGVNKSGIAKRFGTLPGARNVPENWLTRNGGGSFRDIDALAKLHAYAKVPDHARQINFCNTGHWASLGWFVSSELLGNRQVAMYDGSMAEWTADDKLPMQTLAPAN